MHHYFYPVVKSGWDRNRGVIQVATVSVDKRAGIGRMDKMMFGVIIECKHDLEGA